MIRKSLPSGVDPMGGYPGFPKRSCSTKDLERDVDSTSNDRALVIGIVLNPVCRLGFFFCSFVHATLPNQPVANDRYHATARRRRFRPVSRIVQDTLVTQGGPIR
jgi:hypothetical protein